MPRAVALAVRPAQGWRLAADEEATALTDKAYALGELQAIFGRAAWGYLAHLALLVHDRVRVVGVTGDVLFGREVTGLSFLAEHVHQHACRAAQRGDVFS